MKFFKLSLFLFFITLVLSKEFLPLNEEFLLITAFLIFTFSSYNTISTLISSFLDDRSEQFFASLKQLLFFRISTIDATIELNKKLQLLTTSLIDVSDYLQQLHRTQSVKFYSSNKQTLFGLTTEDLEFQALLEIAATQRYNFNQAFNSNVLNPQNLFDSDKN